MATEIQSLKRAFSILEYIAQHDGAGVSELSRAVDLNKSTAFSMLKTLEALGYLYNDESTRKYYLTYRIQSLAEGSGRSGSFASYARPFLQRLLAAYDETIHLVSATESTVVYLEKLESTKPIRIYTGIGAEMPLHCTAVGKAILTYRAEEEVTAYAQRTGLPAMTGNTIVDCDRLMEELRLIKERGYSTDDEEAQAGLYCIGVPVFTPKGVVYALSLSMPKYRKNELDLQKVVDSLHQTAEGLQKFF